MEMKRLKLNLKMLTFFTAISLSMTACGSEKDDKTDDTTIKIEQEHEKEEEFITITISYGDTLSEIAMAHGTTVEEICKINKIKNPDKISKGDEIKIPLVEEYIDENKEETEIYKIKYGDTLSEIAFQYDVTQEKLLELNPTIKNVDYIYVGQKIKVPKLDEHVEEDDLFSPIFQSDKVEKALNIEEWDEKLENQNYITGIDISKHQINFDMDKIFKENDEIDFMYIRSNNFLKNNKTDANYFEDCSIAFKNNVNIGTYFLPSLKDAETAKKEVEILLENFKKLEEKGIYMSLPVAIDIEPSDSYGGQVVPNLKNQDKNTLEALEVTIKELQKKGYYVILYSNDSTITELRDVYKNYTNENIDIDFDKGIFGLDAWVARYKVKSKIHVETKNPPINQPKNNDIATIHQYSEDGRVDVDGKIYNNDIDLDRAYFNYPEFLYEEELNHLNKMKVKKNQG